MVIFKNIKSLKTWRKTKSGKIGFVPTMGALHDGHISLIKKSLQKCNYTIVSIFINPLQFNNNYDLKNYPNTIDKDIKLLQLNKVDALFLPSNKIMYSDTFSTTIEESKISIGLEGKYRPNHFKGVITVVAKLFNIINPTDAFFGKKDAQQLKVIQRIVKDLNYNINIIPCSIIREKSGLAMSSRNKNLKNKDRENANIIYKGLKLVRAALDNGETSIFKIKKILKNKITSNPHIKVLYVSIADDESLKEIKKITNKKILISVAVEFHSVRLIDNITYSLIK